MSTEAFKHKTLKVLIRQVQFQLSALLNSIRYNITQDVYYMLIALGHVFLFIIYIETSHEFWYYKFLTLTSFGFF